MITPSTRRFLNFLAELNDADFRGNVVDRFLSENRFSREDFVPFTHFRKETYGRNLICKNKHFELLVLAWQPQQRTPIHDHAGQRCWMLIREGTLTFKNYGVLTDDDTLPPGQGPTETHSAGEHTYIDDKLGVHSITNCAAQNAVSVHLYAGPVPKCRIYDEAAKCFKWIDLGYYTQPPQPLI